jgi:predicted HTH domain antitoxin
MSRISIDIADDLLQALREQPQDVVQEMRVSAALHYFQTRRLSLGQAARLAGIPRLAFLDVLDEIPPSPLCQRGIAWKALRAQRGFLNMH